MAKKQTIVEKVDHKVGIVVECEDKLLMLKSKDGLWVVPNGEINLKDIVKKSALEILKGDLGFDANIDEVKFGSKFEWDFKNRYVIYYFFRLEKALDFEFNINSAKYTESKWITFKEAYDAKNKMSYFENVLEKIFYDKIK